jgi:proline iminopeptidase
VTYPPIQPRESGLLRVADGAELAWEISGAPDGKSMVWLHGGPGGHAGETYRRRLDPARWNIVGFDQRGSGRSRPLATEVGFDLESLATQRHVEDIEALREHLGIERWLVAGGSWGSTLALAYAEAHPDRVSEIVLLSVTTSARRELAWISEGVGIIFPREWAELEVASGRRPGQPLLEALLERLTDPDPEVREAAALAWGRWEDTHVSLDPAATPAWALLEPETQVLKATHIVNNWAHSAWLGESGVLDGLDRITHLPAVLIHGRLDVSGPLVTAWEVHQRWPGSRLVVVEGEGHGGATMSAELEAAYASFL